ncbi:MAG: hypothetical protein Kow00121_38690 [Elainellaceae cyanobacterium]
MSDTPTPNSSPQSTSPASTASQDNRLKQPSPQNCFLGALIAGGIASALYLLTMSIMQTFASKPLPSGNYLATNIAVAVRTLVTGVAVLATSIFAIAAVGLVALGIQLLVKQLRQPSA